MPVSAWVVAKSDGAGHNLIHQVTIKIFHYKTPLYLLCQVSLLSKSQPESQHKPLPNSEGVHTLQFPFPILVQSVLAFSIVVKVKEQFGVIHFVPSKLQHLTAARYSSSKWLSTPGQLSPRLMLLTPRKKRQRQKYDFNALSKREFNIGLFLTIWNDSL